MDDQDLPLEHTRIVDLSDGLCEGTGRILADLGADVVKVEPTTGAPSRRRGLTVGTTSLTFAVNNANKRSVAIDLESPNGSAELLRLVRSADLVLTGGPGAQDLPPDAEPTVWLRENPSLVVMHMSYFGRTGPYRDWVGTSDVLSAISGLLAQSGLPGREPLLPPVHLIDAAASSQAAWTAMLALWKRQVTGQGETVDFAALEGVAVSLDPAFGISGTARGAADDLPHGRPDARHLYPIFACADGWARICLLSSRQWDNMQEWMGRPAALSDPKLGVLRERYAAVDLINPLISEFFASRTREQIVEESLKFGVPASGLLDPREVLTTPHYVARETYANVEVGDGEVAKMPHGYFDIDGVRTGFRFEAPYIGEHTNQVAKHLAPTEAPVVEEGPGKPFTGLRVLDLGIIVVGAESGRLFADWGADVIKVENRQYPDGNRQSVGPDTVTPSFSRGHRNKRSLGLNLRCDAGKKLLLDLVRKSDIVLSNFKPGTLESLGIGPDVLLATNPRVIVADSSAFGTTGPWSKRMGYGPLVRASSGLSPLWSYPGEGGDGFSDGITIYPDHVASRFVATAVIALLLRRNRTGIGGTVSVAQTDVVLAQMADRIMAESVRPGTLAVVGNQRDGDAPRGIFPTAGNDDWCVIDVGSDEQFQNLARVIGEPGWVDRPAFATAEGRVAHADTIQRRVRMWTTSHSAREAVGLLQERAVPAGFMQRATEFGDDPQFAARGFMRLQAQPQFDDSLRAQNGEAVFSTIGTPLSGPAPILGEHTATVCAEVLGMSDDEIAALVDSGVLEVPPPIVQKSLR